MKLQSIFDQTDFVHASGTKEELQVANYLKEQCETLGVPAELESFRVAMGEIEEAHLYADGMGIPCKALTCCGSGSVEGELYYMPGTDPVSVAGAKDKIVLMDTQGIGFFAYQDLMKAGAKAILFQYGNSYYPHTDIDQRDLREAVVGEEKKVLCAMIHSAQAVELVKNKVKQIRLLQNADQEVVDKLRSDILNTIPAWRNQMVLALGIEHTTRALNAQNALDEMTNELFRKNVETLKQGAIDAALASERSIVDVETLKKINEDIITSINEVVKIHEEGSQKRVEAQEELVKIETELKDALLKAGSR